MRVMRGNLDGTKLETLVDTSKGDPRPGPDATKWCVGIALDTDRGHIYWTQKGGDNAGQGRIFRAGIEIPKGQDPKNRKDIELLYDGLPEPIDLDLDLANRMMYWTDRGDPPRGNTVNRAPLDARKDPEIIFTHLAGLNPAGVICEIANDDGTMACVPDLVGFCGKYALKMVSIADLARYRNEI